MNFKTAALLLLVGSMGLLAAPCFADWELRCGKLFMAGFSIEMDPSKDKDKTYTLRDPENRVIDESSFLLGLKMTGERMSSERAEFKR